MGLAILALGIYAIILSNEDALQVVGSSTLSVPGIVLVILGVFLVVVGFCGWLGALREIFVLLVIVSPPSLSVELCCVSAMRVATDMQHHTGP